MAETGGVGYGYELHAKRTGDGEKEDETTDNPISPLLESITNSAVNTLEQCAFMIESTPPEPTFLQTMSDQHPNMTSARVAFDIDDIVVCGCFPFGRRVVDLEGVKTFTNALIAAPKLRTLIIDDQCAYPAINTLLACALQNSVRLTTLELVNAECVTSDTYKLMDKCSALTKLSISHATQLEADGVRAIAALPELNALQLHGMLLPDRQSVVPGQVLSVGYLRDCTGLQSLSLKSCCIVCTDLAAILAAVPLTYLSLEDIVRADDDVFKGAAESSNGSGCKASLEQLHMCALPGVTNHVFVYLSEYTGLTTLSVTRCKEIDEGTFMGFTSKNVFITKSSFDPLYSK